MTLEGMSAVFSNTQHKNGSASVHSSVVTPLQNILFEQGNINYLKSTGKSLRTGVKVNIRYSQNNGSSNLFNFLY